MNLVENWNLKNALTKTLSRKISVPERNIAMSKEGYI